MSLSSVGLARDGPVARAALVLAATALQFVQIRAPYGGESVAVRVN